MTLYSASTRLVDGIVAFRGTTERHGDVAGRVRPGRPHIHSPYMIDTDGVLCSLDLLLSDGNPVPVSVTCSPGRASAGSMVSVRSGIVISTEPERLPLSLTSTICVPGLVVAVVMGMISEADQVPPLES